MADDLHAVVETRPRRVDQRYTAGRRAVVELLVGLGHPVSIGDISPTPSLTYLEARPIATSSTFNPPGWSAGWRPMMTSPVSSWTEDLTEHHHHLLRRQTVAR